MCNVKHPFDCIVGAEGEGGGGDPTPARVRQPDCRGRGRGRLGAGPVEAASFPSGWLMSGSRNVEKQRNTLGGLVLPL